MSPYFAVEALAVLSLLLIAACLSAKEAREMAEASLRYVGKRNVELSDEVSRLSFELMKRRAEMNVRELDCMRCFKSFKLDDVSMFMCPECMEKTGGNVLG